MLQLALLAAASSWKWHLTTARRVCGRVLVVGDADFSFSAGLQRALAASERPIELLATGYEREAGLHERFPRARAHIEQLRAEGAQVMHGVDATRLPELFGRGFSRIIWNFPHVLGKSNLKRNRLLLRDFLQATTPVLEPGGDVCVALCAGQGGTALERLPTDWSQTWQATAQANEAGHLLVDAVPWAEAVVDGYAPCRSKGLASRAFGLEFQIGVGGLVHVFSPAASAHAAGLSAEDNPIFAHEVQLARPADSEEGGGVASSPLSAAELLAIATRIAGAERVRSAYHCETYRHPSLFGTGRTCDRFELLYQSASAVLTRDEVDQLWARLEQALQAHLDKHGTGATLAKRLRMGVRASRALGIGDVNHRVRCSEGGATVLSQLIARADRDPPALCDLDEPARWRAVREATTSDGAAALDGAPEPPRCARPLWDAPPPDALGLGSADAL
jgi:hypothetical protein